MKDLNIYLLIFMRQGGEELAVSIVKTRVTRENFY